MIAVSYYPKCAFFLISVQTLFTLCWFPQTSCGSEFNRQMTGGLWAAINTAVVISRAPALEHLCVLCILREKNQQKKPHPGKSFLD